MSEENKTAAFSREDGETAGENAISNDRREAEGIQGATAATADAADVAVAEKAGRDNFTSKFAFIISCVGSAVGIGCIWLFPYRIAEFGGAAFLIPFMVFMVLLGFTGVASEMAFGRMAQEGSVGAFSKAMKMRFGQKGERAGKILGVIPMLGALALAIGYSVVVGWLLKYLVGSITGEVTAVADTASYFGALAVDFGSVGWHVLALALTFGVMVFGISKGIEWLNKIMIPLFVVLFVILLVQVAMLPNAMAGYEYLFVPRWEALANPTTWIYALGQAFFSLSLAGSSMLVYGSYLKKDVDVVSSAVSVTFFNICAALLAALVVVPAVFAFDVDLASGPALMFITLPSVFQQMPFGQLFAVLFFLAVICAAVTSLVSLFEAPIEMLESHFGFSRALAVGVVGIIALAVGVFIESADSIGAWMDAVSIYAIPLGALLAAVMFFWVCPRGVSRKQVSLGRKHLVGRWYEPMTRYVFVGITVVVIVLGLVFGSIG